MRRPSDWIPPLGKTIKAMGRLLDWNTKKRSENQEQREIKGNQERKNIRILLYMACVAAVAWVNDWIMSYIRRGGKTVFRNSTAGAMRHIHFFFVWMKKERDRETDRFGVNIRSTCPSRMKPTKVDEIWLFHSRDTLKRLFFFFLRSYFPILRRKWHFLFFKFSDVTVSLRHPPGYLRFYLIPFSTFCFFVFFVFCFFYVAVSCCVSANRHRILLRLYYRHNY